VLVLYHEAQFGKIGALDVVNYLCDPLRLGKGVYQQAHPEPVLGMITSRYHHT
jgi:hypothetical protein